MSAISSIKSLEENHGVYRGKDCMKKFCEYPRECSMEIINFKTKKGGCEQKSSRNHMKMQNSVIFLKKNLNINMRKITNIVNLEIIVILQRNIKVLHIAYVIQNIIFHNGSKCDYHCIINKLAE